MNERHKAVQEMREKRLAERNERTAGSSAYHQANSAAKRQQVDPMLHAKRQLSQSRQPRPNSRQHTQASHPGIGAHLPAKGRANDDIEALLQESNP